MRNPGAKAHCRNAGCFRWTKVQLPLKRGVPEIQRLRRYLAKRRKSAPNMAV